MPTRGICNARCQAFHVAMVRKEESLRIKWFRKNQQKLLDHLKATETQEIIEPSTVKQSSTGIILPKPLPNWRPLKPDGSINMDIMKPIDPRVRAILYHDVPSFVNADNYFHERLKDIPEDRYFFPDCTSWVYGWHLSDYSPVPRSKVGQTNVMIREFFHPRISSLQRDPEWYRPSKYNLSVCVDNAN
ncbi:protein ATP6V1FNB-like [Hylaeus anthracinus]|uniref:protein ATP6V1FNB-like n=1 Tax=Hylaeus anthracinus TaxID=313031 RepID=UPI0023B939EA|nr:protein ATP6V1FNB-like [Hylaeus anthracinus]